MNCSKKVPDPGAPIPEETRAYIEARLRAVEAEDGVRVVFAIESGSRAWGFASPDSDFDVRFIYQHPHDWYMSLTEKRDVIERGVDERNIDLSGWDLRKALRLMLKWNPVLHEWLISPITYVENQGFRASLAEFYNNYANLRAIGHHYDSQARTFFRKNMGSGEVKLKTYFYIIRPVLSLQWLQQHRSMPPMHLDALFSGFDFPAPVRSAIEDLLARKQATPEFGKGPRIPVIDRWIEASIDDADPAGLPVSSNGDEAHEAADALFRRLTAKKQQDTSLK